MSVATPDMDMLLSTELGGVYIWRLSIKSLLKTLAMSSKWHPTFDQSPIGKGRVPYSRTYRQQAQMFVVNIHRHIQGMQRMTPLFNLNFQFIST